MSAFNYRQGRLCVEGVDLTALAQTMPTPFYVYSQGALRAAYEELRAAIDHPRVAIHYAVKANSNVAVIRTLAQAGAGADIVSGGELARCLKAGVPANRIVFSGVGKSEVELAAALQAGIAQFNVESLPELEALSRVAAGLGKVAPVALRVNPDVDANSHAKISTGKAENKFGINWEQTPQAFARAAQLPGLRAMGITIHIGSQMVETAPFAAAFKKAEEMVAALRGMGHQITHVSLGGGIGIDYQGERIPLKEIGALIRETARRLDAQVEIEPGRFLVGRAGALITRVLYVKQGTHRKFLVVDAAMNDLLRPTLYEAYHPIIPVREPAGGQTEMVDVVGPVCETGDYLALARAMPAVATGELLAITHAGAYGASMASTYNSRPLVSEVLVRGDEFAIIRPALTIEQQMGWEYIPDWA